MPETPESKGIIDLLANHLEIAINHAKDTKPELVFVSAMIDLDNTFRQITISSMNPDELRRFAELARHWEHLIDASRTYHSMSVESASMIIRASNILIEKLSQANLRLLREKNADVKNITDETRRKLGDQ